MRLVAALVLSGLTASTAARAETAERFALVAGASAGGAGRATLKYATSDAREVAGVLRQLGGVEEAGLQLLADPDADALRRAIVEARQRVADARAAGRRPELFVYYSGHSDEAGLLLGESALPYDELRRALDEVPAEVRVVILDSCASGAITRSKGGGVWRPAFQSDAANRVRGHAFLTSSAADEASQESDRLRGSFFTHALLTGMRGAADTSGDGVVTLDEAYQFAFRETLARTEATRSGPQHASYDLALVGSGAVVMTDLRRAGAALILPEALSGKIFVRSAAGTLVAELKKGTGTRVELAVDPGAYRVRVARKGRLEEAEVALATAQRQAVVEGRLRAVDLEATVARGDTLDGDGEEVPLAEPAPRAGAPRDRSVLELTLGRVLLPAAHVRRKSGETERVGADAGALLELGYRRWLTHRFSVNASFLVRSLHLVENPNTEELDPLYYGLVGFTIGAKYSHPVFPGRGLFVGLGADIGAYRGVIDEAGTTQGGDTVRAHELIWVPGGRTQLSLDLYFTHRVLLGFHAGYSLIGQLRRALDMRRNQSGFETGLTFGYCWGR